MGFGSIWTIKRESYSQLLPDYFKISPDLEKAVQILEEKKRKENNFTKITNEQIRKNIKNKIISSKVDQKSLKIGINENKNINNSSTIEWKTECESVISEETVDDSKNSGKGSISTLSKTSLSFTPSTKCSESISQSENSTKESNQGVKSEEELFKEEIKERKTKYCFTSKFYQESTNAFLGKMIAYFKTNPIQESLSFINSLDNLTTQHIGKISKKIDRPIESSEKAQYFIFIRDFLFKNGYVSGKIVEMWVKHKINSLKSMNESTKVTIAIQKLSAYIDSHLEEVKSTKEPLKSKKIFSPMDDLTLYGCITYTIFKIISEKRFYHDLGSVTNYK